MRSQRNFLDFQFVIVFSIYRNVYGDGAKFRNMDYRRATVVQMTPTLHLCSLFIRISIIIHEDDVTKAFETLIKCDYYTDKDSDLQKLVEYLLLLYFHFAGQIVWGLI